jgi:hypothetical protein
MFIGEIGWHLIRFNCSPVQPQGNKNTMFIFLTLKTLFIVTKQVKDDNVMGKKKIQFIDRG